MSYPKDSGSQVLTQKTVHCQVQLEQLLLVKDLEERVMPWNSCQTNGRIMSILMEELRRSPVEVGSEHPIIYRVFVSATVSAT